MGTTNILDLNNRVDELEKSYPANKVMLSDGVTSVEDALDEELKILTTEFSFVVNKSTNLIISSLLNIPYAKVISAAQAYNADAYNILATDHVTGYRIMVSNNNGIGEIVLIGPNGGWSNLSAEWTILVKIAYFE